MNRSDICVATITLVRDDEEEQLLRQALTALAQYDLKVYITDGGSPAHFTDFLKSFPNFILTGTDAKGLFAQVTSSMSAAHAAGTPFILYAEPDKKYFFEQGLSHFLDRAQGGGQTGVVLASRADAGFASYPLFQQMTETTINNCCAELTGQPLDYTYGPFLFSRQLVPYLEKVTQDIGWGWRPYVFGIAHRLGLTLAELRGEYHCPPSQQQDSSAERLYRMRQLEQNIRGIVLAAGAAL